MRAVVVAFETFDSFNLCTWYPHSMSLGRLYLMQLALRWATGSLLQRLHCGMTFRRRSRLGVISTQTPGRGQNRLAVLLTGARFR